MLICVKCFADLRCVKNGVLVARDRHYVQAADLYKCPECGFELLTGAGTVGTIEYSNDVYDRIAGRFRRLYKMDKKVILEGEVVNVG